MAIRSQGHSTSPYDSVMSNTGKNASAVDYDPPIPPIITYGDRGLFYAGSQWAPGWGNSQVIDYINLSSTGNATNFGEPTQAGSQCAGTSNTSRGIFTRSNYIDYVTIANTGNAQDFGDLTNGIDTPTAFAGDTNSDRGIICQNNTTSNQSIQTVTISTTGNSSNFGTMTTSKASAGGASNGFRGIIARATTFPALSSNDMIYMTIATGGSTSNFGELTFARYALGGASSSPAVDRAIFAGGRDNVSSAANSYTNIMDYVTFETIGNATDFGNLGSDVAYGRGTNNASKSVFGCFASDGAARDIIEYINPANTGNSTDFGDLTQARAVAAACSGD